MYAMSASTIDRPGAGGARTETYESEVQRRAANVQAMRLTPSEQATLTYVWQELESAIGCKSLHGATEDRLMGLTVQCSPQPGALEGPERWVATPRHIRDKVHEAIEALRRIDDKHAIVLYRVYGYPDPHARHDVFGRELAPLAEYTETVEAERDRLAGHGVHEALAHSEGAAADVKRRHELAYFRANARLESLTLKVEWRTGELAQGERKLAKLRERAGTLPSHHKLREKARKAREHQVAYIKRLEEQLANGIGHPDDLERARAKLKRLEKRKPLADTALSRRIRHVENHVAAVRRSLEHAIELTKRARAYRNDLEKATPRVRHTDGIRRGADQAVTTAMALRNLLSIVDLERLPDEKPEAYKARNKAHRVEQEMQRTESVNRIRREAERLLIAACHGYRTALAQVRAGVSR